MTNLRIGYLFKKKYITYEKKKYEVFEFVDYVAGIGFTNTQNNEKFNVLSGNHSGKYASVINENANEDEYVFVEDSLKNALKANDNRVDFISIRKKTYIIYWKILFKR